MSKKLLSIVIKSSEVSEPAVMNVLCALHELSEDEMQSVVMTAYDIQQTRLFPLSLSDKEPESKSVPTTVFPPFKESLRAKSTTKTKDKSTI